MCTLLGLNFAGLKFRVFRDCKKILAKYKHEKLNPI